MSESPTISKKWTAVILSMERCITTVLRVISHHAATHPKSYLVGSVLFSIGILVLGFFTNFYLDANDDLLWTPAGSKPAQHFEWIQKVYDQEPRHFVILIHANGDNVITQEGLNRVFDAVDTVRETPSFETLCAQEPGSDLPTADKTCKVNGVTSFWNASTEAFRENVSSDQDVIEALSADSFPDGRRVDLDAIVGYSRKAENGTIVFGNSYYVTIELPEVPDAMTFEKKAVDNMLRLRDKWSVEADNPFRLTFISVRSVNDEFGRAIISDIPLIPLVFIIMSVFTCLVFFKRNVVTSQSLLGFGAVFCVLLSIMTGYGLLFVIGVPFTNLTQILPFVMFGIGLDDAFIISGAYQRTDPEKDPIDRIDETIQEVGLSISLTTMTSVLAFGLGSMTSVPAIYLLCYYAFPTIFIDFLYQITFFIALIVVDEHRIQANRRDCCVCITAAASQSLQEGDNNEHEDAASSRRGVGALETPVADKIMSWYADKLLRPRVKTLVLLVFAAMLGGLGYSTSLLTQEFKFTDVFPSDSYVTEFYNAFDRYYSLGTVFPYLYFRGVDQSDPEIQQQMEAYVNDMMGLEAFTEQPPFFWLRDFHSFVSNHTGLKSLSFSGQLNAFLQDPSYNELYKGDIILDENGQIITSRTMVFMSNVGMTDISQQVDVLKAQRQVTREQPINKDQKDWRFFSYHAAYNPWEYYSVAVHELILTTFFGIGSVTAVSLVLIPHWTAALFVLPLISVLYIDLLGFLQLAGAHFNGVTYISLVLGIGLLVDFVIHVLLRYYESSGTRDEKVHETLRTMGSSILIGGVSTFLGIVPLGFSTSSIFTAIFYGFLGLVVLGALHGLVLLPVVLSLVGPVECIRSHKHSPSPLRQQSMSQTVSEAT